MNNTNERLSKLLEQPTNGQPLASQVFDLRLGGTHNLLCVDVNNCYAMRDKAGAWHQEWKVEREFWVVEYDVFRDAGWTVKRIREQRRIGEPTPLLFVIRGRDLDFMIELAHGKCCALCHNFRAGQGLPNVCKVGGNANQTAPQPPCELFEKYDGQRSLAEIIAAKIEGA